MSEDPAQLRHVVVAGRVQGVGFRWFAREKARRLGLKGWVRNRADGSVEVAVAGPQRALQQFLAELAIGPPGASVTAVRALEPAAVDVDQHSAPASVADLPFPFVIQRGLAET